MAISIGTQPDGVSAAELRAAIGHFATGVTVITSTAADGRPFGSTANAVTSVSLAPPLLLVCLRHESDTLAALRNHRRFAVNVLGDGQLALAKRFAARSTMQTWEAVRHGRGRFGVPLLHDAVATLECDLHEIADGGDHQIVIGRVLDVEHHGDHITPLLFYRGEFGRLEVGERSPVDGQVDEPQPIRLVAASPPRADRAKAPPPEPVPPPADRGKAPPPEPVQASADRAMARASLADHLDVFVPTPDGEMRLVTVNQCDRPVTSVIALIGSPRGSRGSLVYLHRGCFLGDALGHLECRSAKSLRRALAQIHGEGTGVVVYHRDDSSPFTGCCVESTPRASVASHEQEALLTLRETVDGLRLRGVRLLAAPTETLSPETLPTETLSPEMLALDVATVAPLFDDGD